MLSLMVTYFKFFVYVLFPVPLILLGLLLLPFPRAVHRHVIKLTDLILFYQPHPHVQVSLFWICMAVSLLTLFACYQSYDDKKSTYYQVKSGGGNTEVALSRLLGTERNIWIAVVGCGLWFLLHRYRSLMKQLMLAEDTLKAMGSKDKSAGKPEAEPKKVK